MGTLSLSKSATSLALDISEIALLAFGILLVIGIIGEYSKSEQWKSYRRAFEILVIVGVAGELIADGGIFLFSSHLETISDFEIAALNKESAQLKQDAGFDRMTAQENSDLNALTTELLRLRVGQANERAAKNEKEVASLTSENLSRQKEVLELRLKLADRKLTPDQQSRIAKALCGFGGRNVYIELYNSDSEMQALAQDINGALSEHSPESCGGNIGFMVSIVQNSATVGFSGVQVIEAKDSSGRSMAFADSLASELRHEGLLVDGPMPEPNRGNVTSGGSAFRVGVAERGPGFELGTPIKIAIGRKP